MIKAVVICEDHHLDEYVVKPVVEQIFAERGRKVRLTFAPRTLIRGVGHALQKSKHRAVFQRYKMANLFLLIIDRDCEDREGKFEERLADAQAAGRTMFGCLAIEELEVWALALHRRELQDKWETVRADCHPKENYFDRLAKQMGWSSGPGRGRKSAMADLRQKWDALKAACPEVAILSSAIGEWLDSEA